MKKTEDDKAKSREPFLAWVNADDNNEARVSVHDCVGDPEALRWMETSWHAGVESAQAEIAALRTALSIAQKEAGDANVSLSALALEENPAFAVRDAKQAAATLCQLQAGIRIVLAKKSFEVPT